jgi:hypothetical protein
MAASVYPYLLGVASVDGRKGLNYDQRRSIGIDSMGFPELVTNVGFGKGTWGTKDKQRRAREQC